MDGLSSDFTSASPSFIAPAARVSWSPGSLAAVAVVVVVAAAVVDARITRGRNGHVARERHAPIRGAASTAFPLFLPFSVFCLLAGLIWMEAGLGVTSLLREKHAWSICFDCGLQLWRLPPHPPLPPCSGGGEDT